MDSWLTALLEYLTVGTLITIIAGKHSAICRRRLSLIDAVGVNFNSW
ncbi:hypothetical protein [Bradyrhizobium sp.]